MNIRQRESWNILDFSAFIKRVQLVRQLMNIAKLITVPTVILVVFFAILLAPANSFAQKWITYNSKGNVRAKGLNINVSYPSDFKISDINYREGNVAFHEDVVLRTFKFDPINNIPESLEFWVGDMKMFFQGPLERDLTIDGDFCSVSPSYLELFKQNNTFSVPKTIWADKMEQRVESISLQNYNGLCGIFISRSGEATINNIRLYTPGQQIDVATLDKKTGETKLIFLNCFLQGDFANKRSIERKFKTFSNNVCAPFFNSLTVLE
ncbi:MAG: hypothetical protein LBO66_00735 [Deltaproteobacteria bacterium]|jgi:hypothetical protein|nr:hypothetical protein [Deltaproteobacteria bacterium]